MSQYIGQLLKDNAGRAPDAGLADVDARCVENKRSAFDCQSADRVLVKQRVERQFDDALDFTVMWSPSCVGFETCDDPRRHEEVAGENIAVGKLSDYQVWIFESKFFVQFTLRRVDRGFADIDSATWQTNLAGVMCKRERAFGERQVPAAGAAE
jgi:hypothetical protein